MEDNFLKEVNSEISREIDKVISSDDLFIFRRFVDREVLKDEVVMNNVLDSGFLGVYKIRVSDYPILWESSIVENQELSRSKQQEELIPEDFYISVDRRGVKIPLGKIGESSGKDYFLTKEILTKEIKELAVEIISKSIERDLLKNAFIYLDILGICDVNDSKNVHYIKGKSLGPSKEFNRGRIRIEQVKYGDDSIEDYVIGKLTMDSVLKFASVLAENKVQSFYGDGYGSYVIVCNRNAYHSLLEDQNFRKVAINQDYSGYIGKCYGQEFWLDNYNMIDRFVANLNPVLKDKAICIFISKNAVKEVIVKPVEVKLDSEKYKDQFSVVRFLYYLKVSTIRGESLVWFVSSDRIGSGGVLVGV
jgi:hypothetical protein